MALANVQERQLVLRALVVTVIVSAVIAAANVSVRLRVAELAYRLAATEEAIQRLQLERRELLAQVALVDEPQRLLHLAQMRLQLLPPAANRRIVLP